MSTTDYDTPDRRPIAARRIGAFSAMAKRLAAARVSANAISVAGMIAGVAAGAVLVATSHVSEPGARLCFVLAAALVPFRLLANMLDGMVAIESGTSSPTGELYNDVPDRVSDAAILIGLGYAVGGNVPLGSAAALVATMTAYIRAAGKAAGAPSQFCGPMAKQQRMAVVIVTSLACAALPFIWRGGDKVAMHLPTIALWIITIGSAWTCIRRLRRIASALGGGGGGARR